MSRYYINENDRITRTDTYLVRVDCADGTVLSELEPRRLFPLSDLGHYITLLNSDEKEVAMIKSLDSLDISSRAAVEECFNSYYMIPMITSIIDVNDKFGVLKWHVITDHGEIQFDIRNRHSDIKVFDNIHLFVRDSNDNRYLSDLSKLDKISLRKIYSYL